MKCRVFVVRVVLLMPFVAAAGMDISYSFSPTLHAGMDDLGLVGSIVTLSGTIDGYSTYVYGGAGVPYAVFSSGFCVISGASVPSNNGVFALTNTVSLGAFPNTEGVPVFFAGSDAQTPSRVILNGGLSLENILIVCSADSSFSPSIGELVDVADFEGAATVSASTFMAVHGGAGVAVYGLPADVTNTVVVEKDRASVTLSATNQVYDGTARSVTAITDPVGLAVEFTYDGSPHAPTNSGSYVVTGTVRENMFEGSAASTLVVQRGNQIITFDNPGAQEVTNTIALVSSASSGLEVEFEVISGPAVLVDSNLSFSGAGSVSVAARQDGDLNWRAASSVTNTFEVLGVAMVAITNPASDTGYVDTMSISISGTNNEWVVGSLVWTNAANGSNGAFSVSGFTFEVPNVPLELGANLISVSGTNLAGSASSDSVTITRTIAHGGVSLIHYVSPDGGNLWPFTNWVTAATVIQDAIDAASSGDRVLVTNGVYSSGGAEVSSVSNRVALINAVMLQSVNGPDVTLIVGAADPVSTNGPAAVRCAYVTTNAVLDGFTLTNGHTRASGEGLEGFGGGVVLDGGGLVANCTIIGNAGYRGGGAFCAEGGTLNYCTLDNNTAARMGAGAFLSGGGTLNHCTLINNSADSMGGGGVLMIGGATLNNCLISGNSAAYGGGSAIGANSVLRNCTISHNSAEDYGGGVSLDDGGTLSNCILWDNTAGSAGVNWYEWTGGVGSFTNVCTAPLPTNGVNCIVGDPQFVDQGAGDYRLQSGSLCIDAGIALDSITDDIEGTPRPLNGDGLGEALPDIGAYEHSSPLYSTDGDDHTDYEEYIADTDATDSNHWFRITGLSAGVPSTIWFGPASVNRQYTLSCNTNLVEGGWSNVAGQTDMPGSGGTNSLAHTNSYPAAFYRVEVELIE